MEAIKKTIYKITDQDINDLYSGNVHLLIVKNASETDIEKFGDLENQDLYGKKRVPVGTDDAKTEEHVWQTYEMLWHSDRAYLPDVHPFVGLYCKVADIGSSPTYFCDNFKAWQNLSDNLKAKIKEENPVHFSIRTYFERTTYPHTFRSAAYERLFKIKSKAYHNLYRNDIWGEYLFYSQGYAKTKYFEELNEEAFIDENCFSHIWEPGDLLVFNNLTYSHRRDNTDEKIRRRLMRYAFRKTGNDTLIID